MSFVDLPAQPPRSCPRCGHDNPPLASFCESCGADLYAASATRRPRRASKFPSLPLMLGGVVALAAICLALLIAVISMPVPGEGAASWSPSSTFVADVSPSAEETASADPTPSPTATSSPTPEPTETPEPTPSTTPEATPAPTVAPPVVTPPPPAKTPAPPAATAAPPASDGLVALPALSVSIPGATVNYYPVSGTDPAELSNSARQALSGSTQEAFAYTSFDFANVKPNYQTGAGGTCTMTTLSGKPTYSVTMPRWTSPSMVHPALLDWWKAILDHARWHESEHISITNQYVGILGTRIAGKSCDSWSSIIATWETDMMAAHQGFDQSETNWYDEFPYNGPWDW